MTKYVMVALWVTILIKILNTDPTVSLLRVYAEEMVPDENEG